MGLYDILLVEDGIELPNFPPGRSPTEIEWQTKEVGHPFRRKFKLTTTGRLFRQEEEKREKTKDEKRDEASEHGFDSWDEYVSFCETADLQELLRLGMGIGIPDEKTVEREFWLDHNMHGSFEFHGSKDDIADGFYWSYEARFTEGELDAIVFLGKRSRHDSDGFDPDGPVIVRY